MIKTFTIQNFMSILDLTLDFTYDEGKAPNGYEEMETLPFLEINRIKKKPIRVVPCMAIYGANAAGKSNIIYGLYALKKIIYNGITGLYKPNKLNKKYNSTTFKIEIFIENEQYTYEIEYNEKEILKEILIINKKELFKIENNELKANNIYTKVYNKAKLQEIYEVECFNAEKMQHKTFLNVIANNYTGLNIYVSIFALYMNLKMQAMGHTDYPINAGLNILEVYCGKEKQQSFNEIVDILKKFDFDIINMKYEEEYITDNVKEGISKENTVDDLYVFDNKLYKQKIFSYHKDINNNEVEFDFRKEESLGTKVLAGLLGPILATLHLGSILCIDELERSIHPLVLREIIKMFKSKRYNKNNAQLIFTAHNTDILDDEILRVSEIAFASKNISSGTVIRRASSFKGLRNVNNFRKKYLNGEFSAIPYPYI